MKLQVFFEKLKNFLCVFPPPLRRLYTVEQFSQEDIDMRKSWKILALVLILVVALTACRSKDKDTANGTGTTPPSQSVHNGNDAMNGGGAGGVNDPNGSDHMNGGSSAVTPNPNATLTPDPQATGGGLMEDVGDAVGDVGNAVGDVAEGVGDAIGNAGSGTARTGRNP